MHRRLGFDAALLALAVLSGCGCGCGGSGSTGTALPSAPPTRSVPPSSPLSVIGNPADCPVSALRPVIERGISIAEGTRIGEVRLLACRNDYAQVLLIAQDAKSVDPLPVFLRRTAGEWGIVGFGTDIDCTYPDDLPDKMVTACQALGL